MIGLCKKKFRRFGEGAEFRPGAYAIGCSKIEIGKRVVVRPGTMLFGEIENHENLDASISIEDDVMMGSGIHIYINNHRFDRTDVPLIEQGYTPSQRVILRKGCWVGANAIILSGVEIGENTVIGAGSVVTKSFPKGVVVAGNPANIIKRIGNSSQQAPANHKR